jgi:ankyrin
MGGELGKVNQELIFAAVGNDNVGVRAALAAGADVNFKGTWENRQYTSLHHAAASGHAELAQVLIEAGASLTIRDKFGSIPLDAALQFYLKDDAEDFCLWLAEQTGSLVKESAHAIGFAAQNGMVQVIDKLAKLGARLDSRGIFDLAPLHAAAWAGSVAGVARMFALGGDIEVTQRHGDRPLHTAVTRNNIDVVRWLLEAGANPNATQVALYTPLHYAASHNNAGVVGALLRAGADPSLQNKYGLTPFRLAIERGSVRVMVRLEQAGCGEQFDQSRLDVCLAAAAKAGHVEMVRELLSRGADPSFRPDGKTLLQYAKSDAVEVKKLILAARAGEAVVSLLEATSDAASRAARAGLPSL